MSSASFGSARSSPGREAAKRTLDGEDPGVIAPLCCLRCRGRMGGPMDSNSLYYGDNLDILRRYVRDESPE